MADIVVTVSEYGICHSLSCAHNNAHPAHMQNTLTLHQNPEFFSLWC